MSLELEGEPVELPQGENSAAVLTVGSSSASLGARGVPHFGKLNVDGSTAY